MTTYQKYVQKLSVGCTIIQKAMPAIVQAPVCNTEEDVNARIAVIDAAIKAMQDAKRDLLYFKNRVAGSNVL